MYANTVVHISLHVITYVFLYSYIHTVLEFFFCQYRLQLPTDLQFVFTFARVTFCCLFEWKSVNDYVVQTIHKNFNNSALPGRWWLQNLILRHNCNSFFRAVSSPLNSKFSKSVNMIFFLILWQKCNMGIKKHSILGWFWIVEKVAKKLMWKKLSAKKWQKNEVFDFYDCMHTFSEYTVTSFGWNFCICFNGVETHFISFLSKQVKIVVL